jgi:hypothetical protein
VHGWKGPWDRYEVKLLIRSGEEEEEDGDEEEEQDTWLQEQLQVHV